MDILRRLGVRIDREAEQAVELAKESDPDVSTIDIIQRLSIAPQGTLDEAIQILEEAHPDARLQERYTRATASARDARRAAYRLSLAASAIAAKK